MRLGLRQGEATRQTPWMYYPIRFMFQGLFLSCWRPVLHIHDLRYFDLREQGNKKTCRVDLRLLHLETR